MQCFCNSEKEATIIHRSDVASVFRCRNCSAILSEIGLDTNQLYDDNYFETYVKIEDDQIANSKYLLSIVKKFKSTGSILDYGCGTGIFLKIAGDMGYTQNVGVDHSEAALEVARTHVSLPDMLVRLGDQPVPDRKFEVIAFVDSLAHVPEAPTVLHNLLHNNLATDGILFIRTPNISKLYCLYARILSTFLPAKYGDQLFFVPNRYLSLSRQSMDAFISSIGFEAVYWSFQRDYAIQSRNKALRARFADYILRTIPRRLNPHNSMTVIARPKAS